MIKLVRLDYRLLHGQVVFGWVNHISAQRIIIVDDVAAWKRHWLKCQRLKPWTKIL